MRFRDPKKNGDPPPECDSSGNMFTLCIHTGGSIHRGIDHAGGDVYKFDHVKRDLFSIDSLKKFASYMDDNEIEVLYTKNDDGQFEQINTESEFRRYSGKAVSEGKELEIYILGEGKSGCDVQGGRNSDNSDDGDFVLGNEHESADGTFVDNKDIGVGEDQVCEDDEVVDDGSVDDDVALSKDDFNSVKDSDSENEGHKCPIDKQTSLYDPHLELNMSFSNKKELIDVVHLNAVVNKRVIKITKRDKSRVYFKCQWDDCEWKIHAISILGDGTFQIRTYIPTHSCPEYYHVKSSKSRWLSDKYGYQFKNDPKTTASALKNGMSFELGVHQAYKCRELALQDQYDNVDDQYKLLWDYAQEIRRTNPGSTVVISSDQSSGSPRFDWMYICLNAMKEGFLNGCRPLIGVDGCHLKGPHKVILLSAVGVDPNNDIFPIAYAVVRKENGDMWQWFLTMLKVDLKIVDDTNWTFISDKQNGMVQAFQNIFPNSSHRFCVRHLYSNMKNAGFRGQTFKIALHRIAKSTTVNEFNRKMNDMKELSEMVVQWLNYKPPQHWSRSHFNSIPRCDIVMNNPCDSYNRSILPGREMPILSMLEWLMEHLMQRFQQNRDRANRGKNWKGVLCPRIQKQVHESAKHNGGCTPLKDDDKHYQVRCTDGSQYSVDLEKWTCGCRKWDLTGIPCIHAITAIHCQGLKPEDFTHECYRVSTYKMVYDPCIMPINGRSEWVSTEFMPLLPPVIDRSAPNARREPDEPIEKQKKRVSGTSYNDPYRMKRHQVTLKCSNCHEFGHNKRKCKNEKVVNPTEENVLECLNLGEERVDQTPSDNSQVTNDDVPNQTRNIQEPPPIIYYQFLPE